MHSFRPKTCNKIWYLGPLPSLQRAGGIASGVWHSSRTENCLQSFFNCLLRGLDCLLRSPWSTVEDKGNELSWATISSHCDGEDFYGAFLRVAQHLPQPHDWIFFPSLEHFCPTFRTNCPHRSLFFQMGSHYAQNTTTNPCSLLSRHKPLSGICMYTRHPQPHPKTPLFLAWTWKWAKCTTVWANWTPTGQIFWKVDKTFLEVGKKKWFFRCTDTRRFTSIERWGWSFLQTLWKK